MYLEIKNITKSYNENVIIKDINIDIEKGEFVSLLGKSGVGKTTLFNILSGVEKQDDGSIYLEGEDITGKSGEFSYMQQKDLLLPFYTTLDNICLPLRLKNISKKEAYEKAGKFLEEFGLLGAELKYPNKLSGGMRQRVALLRAYLYSQKLMLLDEPFSALDAITKQEMHKWYLDVCKKHKTTTFFITHDIDEALVLSDKILVMKGKPGKIVGEISIKEKTENFQLSEEFINYKKILLEKIKL